MIVPMTRLMTWVAIVALPLAALGAVVPEFALWSALLIALFLIVATWDAVLALGSLEGISLELPEIVRLWKDRNGAIELQIKNLRQKSKRLRFGLLLPPEILSPEEVLPALLPDGAERSRLSWPCTPVKRGKFLLDKCYLEGSSPWGFWAFRKALPARSEIRVYPNLMSERKSVAALFLNRGSLGIHSQRQVGQGRDFEKLRDYISGDSVDEIHWRATAKRGHPVTKVFQLERTQEVYAIIDASRLMARIQSDSSEVGALAERPMTSTLERLINAALMLGLAAEQQGDLFGLVVFSDKIHRFVRAKNGKTHYSACREALYTIQPQIVTPDFDELCTFIRLRLRRRALLVFLTALDDPILAEHFVHSIDLISRQHLVVVNMLRRPGARPIFSDPNVVSIDDLYKHLGGHVRWQNLKELEKVLQRRGVRFYILENERLSAELITQYIGIKQRQLL